MPARSVIVASLMCVLAGLSGCKKGFVEQSIDGMRWLQTRSNSQKNGTARVELEVLPGETAMLSTVEVADGFQVHYRSLIDPVGTPIFQAFDWTGTEYSKTNAGYVSEVSTLNWPISAEDPELVPGTYTLEFGVVDGSLEYVAEPLFVDVLLKPDDRFDSGLLQVDLIYVGGLDQDDELRRAMDVAIDHWRDLYEGIGLEIDVVELTYADADDLEPPAFGSPDVYLDISGSSRFRGVNVVVTPNILAEDQIFGISGDIPGPLVPTERSAVLISAGLSAGTDGQFSPEEERLLAETMAHEVGHFIGLFHPVEVTWETWDVLDDTPTCESEFDCILELGTNLMFPFPVCAGFSCTPQGDVTEEQVGVAHRYVGVE